MLTFVVGTIACIAFPPLILGVLGFWIGGVFGGVIGTLIGIAIMS